MNEGRLNHLKYVRGCKPELVRHLIRVHGHIYPTEREMRLWRIDELVSAHTRDHAEEVPS